MKIYRVPVSDLFRPNHQDFVWPPQNAQPGYDKGVEQDWDDWILLQDDLLVDDPAKADWLYVPIFWNRYYINNAWGDNGREELAEEVDRIMAFDMPTFTISEADIKWIKPYIDWRHMQVFCSSRRDENGGIDIPLLCAPHQFPEHLPEKKYFASFMGNLKTDGTRIDMYEALKHRWDCRIEHANVPSDVFARVILESYISLCPRGQGAQSYRMYESMELGTVPLYISDLDCRPFRNWIDWDICSLLAYSVDGLNNYIENLKPHKDKLTHMGYLAKCTYDYFLSYGKWCKFVIRELELI